MCAQITPTVADKILDAYSVPSKLKDTYKNDLINMISGSGVSILDMVPETFIPNRSEFIDIIKKF